MGSASGRDDDDQSPRGDDGLGHRARSLCIVAAVNGTDAAGPDPDGSAEILVAVGPPALGRGVELWIDGAPFPRRSAGVVHDFAGIREALTARDVTPDPAGTPYLAANTSRPRARG